MSTTATFPPPAVTRSLPPPTGNGAPAEQRTRHDKPKRQWGLAALGMLALLGLAVTLFMVASLALFTDTENVGANTFGTGTVDIAALPATAVFTPGPMAPGDQVTAEIDVSNGGSLALRYALTSSTTEDALASTLRLTVKTGVAVCDNTSWNATGAVIYPNVPNPSGVLGATTIASVFGDVTPGNQTGDRTLAPGAFETLCLNVTLPLATGNGSRNLSTTATFNFEAEQTANNP